MNRYRLLSLLLPALGISGAALAQQSQQVDPARFADRVMEADSNGDNQVTRAELAAYRNRQWSRMDRNGDGYFSKDDLPRFVQGRWDSGRPAELRRAYDSDGDGRISQGEFVNGPALVFDMADTNRDNVVTRAELDTAVALAQSKRNGG